MSDLPNPDILEALRRIDAPSLANAIESLDLRLRNEGFTDSSIRCLFPHMPAVVGFAATVTIRGANPPVGAHSYIDRTDWWDYIASLPSPRILVIQDLSSRPGSGSLLGEVHANILRALNCTGALTNGSVRDIPALERLGFQCFTGGISVSHSYIHVVEFGIPVQVAGLRVRSGELLHGDMHGVQSIPEGSASRLPAIVERMTAVERRLIEVCRSGSFSTARLRQAMGNPGA